MDSEKPLTVKGLDEISYYLFVTLWIISDDLCITLLKGRELCGNNVDNS